MFAAFICLIFVLFSVRSFAAAPQTKPQKDANGEKRVLFINSYGYDFETVPIVMSHVHEGLSDIASIQYIFMNEKYISDKDACEKLAGELDILTGKFTYDAVILGDDAAFDFAVKNREKYFSGIPLIYENVNSFAKAEKHSKDHTITGVVEAFPIKNTIETARKIQHDARRVVVITDNSVSGAGSAGQAMAQQKFFPDLRFEIFDCSSMTGDEIKKNIAAYEDAILLYTVFNVDGDGQRYTMAQGVRTITDAARVPVFKADEAGMGDGLLGGYQLSYESIGNATAEIVRSALRNAGKPLGPFRTGRCVYQFDRRVMDRFGVKKSELPEGSVYINDTPSFYEQNKHGIRICVIAALLIVITVMVRRRVLLKKLDERGRLLRAEESANRAKSDFLSRMSHDIRTPLNGIIGMTYLAEKEDNPPATAAALAKIDISSKFLLGLINNILNMSKVESNKVELSPEPFPFAKFMEYINSVILPLCREKNIKFVTDFKYKSGYMPKVDILRLNQIFFNLFSNAVKYTPEGGTIKFTIMEKLSDDKKTLAIDSEIADNGIGMSEKFQKVLFDPFTQEREDDGAKAQGSGLGLAIVKRLVDLMGGTISVESKQGIGTTVRLHFEAECVNSDSAAAEKNDATTYDSAEVLSGRRILLCEDHPINTEIAEQILSKAGCKTYHAEDGQKGVEMFGASVPGFYDLILMDIRMPVMDGLEAARAIRALDRPDAASVPIIAMTANAFDDDVKASFAAGMNAHLSKPIDPPLFYKVIAEQISKNSGGAAKG